jgi:hypothetical protein
VHHASSDLASTGIGLLAIFVTMFLVILAFGGARMARARFSVFSYKMTRTLTTIAVLLAIIFFLGDQILDEINGFLERNR